MDHDEGAADMEPRTASGGTPVPTRQPATLRRRLEDEFGVASDESGPLADRLWRWVVFAPDDMGENDLLELAEEAGVPSADADRLWDVALTERRDQLSAIAADAIRTPLQDAFADLESQGVTVRPDFSCCTSCGHQEMVDEVADTPGDVDLYVFFHEQDVEAITATEPGVLYLRFGSVQRSEQETTSLVRDVVVSTLARHGVDVTWDGTLDAAVVVNEPSWYVPLPGPRTGREHSGRWSRLRRRWTGRG